MADFYSFSLYVWLVNLITAYLNTHPIAQVMGLDIGFQVFSNGEVITRKPDLAVILNSNPVKVNPTDRTFQGACDLCIEFLSDSTPQAIERDTIIKKEEYESIGVQEYFILDRLHQHTAFYRLQKATGTGNMKYQAMELGLLEVVTSQVLPGFAFRLSDLKTLPSLEKLIKDPVYQPFVLKSLREEIRKKEQIQQKATQAFLKREEQAKEEVTRLRMLLLKKG